MKFHKLLWVIFALLDPDPADQINADPYSTLGSNTDKKENKIFLIHKEIQKGTVAKSYMTNGLLIYD
jgi:hypothetical protein